MNQYQLKKGVYFVTGTLHGAIYDTNTGLVYSVNHQACNVLKYELADDLFWGGLEQLGLAEACEDPMPPELPVIHPGTGPLRFIWFEVVTDRCNQYCVHCYADARPASCPAADQNNQPDASGLRMRFRDWENAIHESYRLGCRECQFIGGEPFLYRGEQGETITDLLLTARQAGFERVEVFTNGTLIRRRQAEFMRENGIRVAVSLYSDQPEIHDTVTRTPGSHQRTLSSLALLKELGVETRVETVVVKANQSSVEATVAFREGMGYKGKKPSPLWPCGRGENSTNLPDTPVIVRYGLKLLPNFWADEEKIALSSYGNPCLYGKTVITEYGDVYPCIFSRQQHLGNYLETGSLRPAIEGALCQQIWQANKDSILVCKDCEYRYVCFDCRVLSEAAANGKADYFTAPYPRCTYTPYSGEWGDGLWKVNDDGEPVYDRRCARAIRKGRQILLKSLEKR